MVCECQDSRSKVEQTSFWNGFSTPLPLVLASPLPLPFPLLTNLAKLPLWSRQESCWPPSHSVLENLQKTLFLSFVDGGGKNTKKKSQKNPDFLSVVDVRVVGQVWQHLSFLQTPPLRSCCYLVLLLVLPASHVAIKIPSLLLEGKGKWYVDIYNAGFKLIVALEADDQSCYHRPWRTFKASVQWKWLFWHFMMKMICNRECAQMYTLAFYELVYLSLTNSTILSTSECEAIMIVSAAEQQRGPSH